VGNREHQLQFCFPSSQKYHWFNRTKRSDDADEDVDDDDHDNMVFILDTMSDF